MSTFWTVNRLTGAGIGSPDERVSPSRIDELQAMCDRALLVSEALWTILRDRLGIPEEELVRQVNDIDLSDGKLDGRVRTAKAQACPKCKRTVAKRFLKCIYCGAGLASVG